LRFRSSVPFPVRVPSELLHHDPLGRSTSVGENLNQIHAAAILG
jgi:hypothetical protein